MGCVGARAEADLRCGHWIRCGRFLTGLKIKRADEDCCGIASFLTLTRTAKFCCCDFILEVVIVL